MSTQKAHLSMQPRTTFNLGKKGLGRKPLHLGASMLALAGGLGLWAPASAQSIDNDLDGVPDVFDNCVAHPNATQTDTDVDGYGDRCDADFNNDGGVGMDDINALLAHSGTAEALYDLNGDGGVGYDDLNHVLGVFNTPPGPSGLSCSGTIPCVALDTDGDGLFDEEDNCTHIANPDQEDTDQDGFGDHCDADFNNDGFVGMDDLSSLLSVLNTASQLYDLNNDGLVGLDDLSLVITLFYTEPGPSGLSCAIGPIDADADGVTACGGDCDDTDSEIFPGNWDDPSGDGLDSNCDGHDYFSLAGASAAFVGENSNDRSGQSISSGDIDGDGFDDIIIGATQNQYGYMPGIDMGKTYVVFGASAGINGDIDLSAAQRVNPALSWRRKHSLK